MSYLPQCPYGSILITTRNEDKALKLIENEALKLIKRRDIITINPINSKDALKLFKNKLEGDNDGNDNAGLITKLLVTLKLMLLAIVQAAAYILRKK